MGETFDDMYRKTEHNDKDIIFLAEKKRNSKKIIEEKEKKLAEFFVLQTREKKALKCPNEDLKKQKIFNYSKNNNRKKIFNQKFCI